MAPEICIGQIAVRPQVMVNNASYIVSVPAPQGSTSQNLMYRRSNEPQLQSTAEQCSALPYTRHGLISPRHGDGGAARGI